MRRTSSPQQHAANLVQQAIKKGNLTRLDYCEVCRRAASTIVEEGKFYGAYEYASPLSKIIFAHHWRGYDYPLDVWWVCISCNTNLRGKHDGSLPDPAKAQEYIRHRFDEKGIYLGILAFGQQLKSDPLGSKDNRKRLKQNAAWQLCFPWTQFPD